MRYGLVLALLLAAAPANAQTDESNCVALAERMDAKVAAKQKPSAQEQEQLAACIGEFNCDELTAAANAGRVPVESVNTNAKAMRYTLRACGNTSAAAQEPKPKPEPAQPSPGSAFGKDTGARSIEAADLYPCRFVFPRKC